MALLIGQPITGRAIEQVISPWSPERFASMCDALVWAVSGRQFPGLPAFTTRVNAKDGGIDAEWQVDIPDEGHQLPTPIVGPGWNVFQYKKRDLIAQDRRRVISNLKSSLIGAVSQLVQDDKDGRRPDHYVLFSGVDKSLSWRPSRPSMPRHRRRAWIYFSAHKMLGRTLHRHRSTRLRHDVYQGGAAFLDDDFEGALERWPQGACVFHRPFGVYAKSPRHRGKIHRRLS
jgi:hypothetical protein